MWRLQHTAGGFRQLSVRHEPRARRLTVRVQGYQESPLRRSTGAHVAGLCLAVGFGGHGFLHSPATGCLVAEWIIDGLPSMDLSLFDPARFAKGAPRSGDAGRGAE